MSDNVNTNAIESLRGQSNPSTMASTKILNLASSSADVTSHSHPVAALIYQLLLTTITLPKTGSPKITRKDTTQWYDVKKYLLSRATVLPGLLMPKPSFLRIGTYIFLSA